VVFVTDALGAWLVGLLADASRKKLTTLVLGTDQQRALRQAAVAAVERTAEQLTPAGGEQAEQLAIVVGEVFREPTTDAAVAWQVTLLEALEAGVADRLAVLDDPDITGTGQSSAELLGVPGSLLAQTLAGHLVRQIIIRGSRGGPLASLANQLNFDVIHLQGQRLEDLFAELADQLKELAAAGSATLVLPTPPRPHNTTTRGPSASDLGDRLTRADAEGPRVVVLCGLGGVGKTSVALEYAHRHLDEVRAVWQFPAEDPAVLAAGFGELAAQLGARDSGDPVASVHGVLAACPTGWLLVFDNAPDRASIEGFLPPAGTGRVLITSRDPFWPPSQVLDVPVLDREVAADFLGDRTGDSDRQTALELADELGGLPLALEQAAAYIQATGDTLAGYLASFRQRRPDMLARGKAIGYDSTVAATWSLAFGELGRFASQAAGLLRLLACCAPEAIPLQLLLQLRPGLAGTLGDQVAPVLVPLLEDELARYALYAGGVETYVAATWDEGDIWIATMRHIAAEGRCWVIGSLLGMRSPRCAATRWSPWQGTTGCWCTVWSRPSPSPRCPRTWPASGSRPPRPWSRPRSPPIRKCPRPGRCARCYCRTRGLP